MLMKRLLILYLILLCFCGSGVSQHNLNGLRKIEIPFQFENNFIIVDIQFNNTINLKFIFDTGAEYTILTKREIADIMGIRYEKEFKLMGADLSTELSAYLARGINFKIGDIENPNQDFLVMGDDYFKFESLTGVNVHGIIGANFFSRYVVKINYRKKIITLYDPQFFKPPENYEVIPISIYKNKPYVDLESKLFAQDSTTNIRLLIDSGASLTLLLYTDTHPALEIPEKSIRANIGIGLGGFIEGGMGRFHEISVGSFKINNLVASYQDMYNSIDTTELNSRNGLLGNMVLSRFDLILDYHHEKLYLKPNKSFKKRFKFDRSGLVFLATGHDLNTFSVSYVVPGSPADKAGILKGDEIKRVNWLQSGYINLSFLVKKLHGRVGKKIRLVIRRDGKKIKKTFTLRDLI